MERGVGRGETNAFDHGLEFIRSAMFLAVLLAFRDLSLAFGDSGWSEQKHLRWELKVGTEMKRRFENSCRDEILRETMLKV